MRYINNMLRRNSPIHSPSNFRSCQNDTWDAWDIFEPHYKRKKFNNRLPEENKNNLLPSKEFKNC